MHERSLVRALMTQVDALVASHGGGTPQSVRLELGPLSGVEPALVRSAWEQLRGPAGFERTTLEIDQVPLVARCRACGETFEPVRFCFRCPQCGGAETEAISGDGVVLHSIVIDDSPQGAVR
jgi:hydrogenase nickel incorporation protein HypA/HybF